MTPAPPSVTAPTNEDLVSKIRRPVRWFERQSVWLFLFLLGAGAAGAAFSLIGKGRFEHLGADLWGRNLRGYTAFGELTGGLTVALSGLALGLSLRKRWFQEARLPLRGTLMSWLSSHVAVGLLAMVTATVHAGYGLLDSNVSTGKILYWLLLVVSAAGVAWRLAYRFVPGSVFESIGNYSLETSAARARHQTLEIEKLCAGASAELHRIKDWLLDGARTAAEVASARTSVLPQELASFDKMAELAASRSRALLRYTDQRKAVRKLQWWRLIHVPLSLMLLFALPVHLVGAYNVLPEALAPSSHSLGHEAREATPYTGEHPVGACKSCHAEIYAEWQDSMHAHAMKSPVMIAQNNRVAEKELKAAASPDPKLLCVTCHGPGDVRLAPLATLPLPGGDEGNHGIDCTVCHQFAGKPVSGSGAFTRGFASHLTPGPVFYGPIEGAVGNTYHRSEVSPLFRDDPSGICQDCHDVHYDRDANGKLELGKDLVLQLTYQEYLRYRQLPGATSCVDCHMPLKSTTRAADAAKVPFDQDYDAPPRAVRTHSFVGVDYLLSLKQTEDPQRPLRHGLLKAAATLDLGLGAVGGGAAAFTVTVTNTGAGHDLPSGFAFMRQMWIELTVDSPAGRIFSSGVLATNTDDLCDAATLADPGMAPLMKGCAVPDPFLVNFQRKLVDKTEPKLGPDGAPELNVRGEMIPIASEGALETSIQRIAGNPVARKRPVDGQILIPIEPRETRTFQYKTPLAQGSGQIKVTARLLFRHLPPYSLRSLAAQQPAGEVPQLGPLIENLDVVEMAAVAKTFEL